MKAILITTGYAPTHLQPVFNPGQVITWEQIQPVRRVTRFMKTSQLGKWAKPTLTIEISVSGRI